MTRVCLPSFQNQFSKMQEGALSSVSIPSKRFPETMSTEEFGCEVCLRLHFESSVPFVALCLDDSGRLFFLVDTGAHWTSIPGVWLKELGAEEAVQPDNRS